ncbi:dipeptide ABC transporter ATP-binding protein [Granulicoccus sp. GXG6511]|uniref:dipeptide ABC transporter ATP-binding protein n=1 Tax=Granulicoccus sp. GXG6511 TaxID=3381351 RepID=UPI003D7D6278
MTAVAQPGTGPFVRIEDLSISYRTGRDRPAIDVTHDVDLAVDTGQTLAIVGESGSGKSTVARTLLAYLRGGSFLRSGQVFVDDTEVFSLTGEDLRRHRGGTVALVAQNAGQALTPSMRVGRQVAEALEVHGRTATADHIAELLEHVKLPGRLARAYPHQLSGGQQQRVAIAMAVAARPKVLVLDEPTTALDVLTQASVLRLLRDLAAELQTATVLVSHDLGVVAGMADEVAVMRAGRVVERSGVRTVLRDPSHDYTRQLLASAPRLDDNGIVEVHADGTRTIRPRPDLLDPDIVVTGTDVAVTYGRGAQANRAVDGVDITVRRGEILALVGESGSGKSTLAWAVAGLNPISDGTLVYSSESDGASGGAGDHDLSQPVRKRPIDLRRRIQLAFQNADTALNPRVTVATSLARPLKLFKTVPAARIGERQRELMEQVDLPEGFLRRLPGQLSGGQRQRVGIARALAGDPSIIIADEITTALDVSVQAQVLRLLDDIRRDNNLSCLFISHDLAVVHGVADRVMVMHAARVVEEGPVEAVFADPRHPYTKELLGATLAAPGDSDERPDPLNRVAEDRTWVSEESDGWEDAGNGHRWRRWRSTQGGS